MSTQEIERRIIGQLIDDAFEHGYKISVNDGEEWVLIRSTDKTRMILDAMFSTDSDTLIFRSQKDDSKAGSVLLIYGNGWDVISDYSDNEAMADLLAGATALADRLSASV